MQNRQSQAVVCGAQLHENGHKWKIRNHLGFFTMRLMEHCNRLSEEAVESVDGICTWSCARAEFTRTRVLCNYFP